MRPGAEISLTLPRGPPVGTADREVDSGGLPVSTADREVDLGGLPVGAADREGGSGGPPVGTADREVGSVPTGSGFQASHRSTRLTGRGFRRPPADTVLGAGSEKLLPRDAHSQASELRDPLERGLHGRRGLGMPVGLGGGGHSRSNI